MTLYNLSIDELECIAQYLNADDKSNLLMTGCKIFMSRLVQVATDISVLPHDTAEIESLYEDDEGFHIITRYVSCTDMETSISITSNESTYGLLPLYFKNAKSAVLHDVHLERALKMMSKLEKLRVYICHEWTDRLLLVPSTLRELTVDMPNDFDTTTLIQHIPQTLRALTLNYKDVYVPLTSELMSLLPRNLESLSGVFISDNEVAWALPPTLTYLECGDLLAISPFVLPSTLKCLDCEWVDITSLTHLHLLELHCSIESADDLPTLQSLTKLTARGFSWSIGRNWNSPVRFPSSLTDLTIQASSPACCLVPATVKKLTVYGRHNVFEEATCTWKCKGSDVLLRIPTNVVHANVYADGASLSYFDQMLHGIRDTVESLSLESNRCDFGSYYFHSLMKCKKLILPPKIVAITLPPALTHFEGCGDYDTKLPSTLQHLITPDVVTVYELRNMPALTHLECDGAAILGDTASTANIQHVVLQVPSSLRSTLPALHPTAKYEYYDE